MYKVLVFMENEITQMEKQLNEHKNYDVVTTWSTGNRIVFVMRLPKGPGRPATKKEENIEQE